MHPLFLSDFKVILIFCADLQKNTQMSNFMKGYPVGADFIPCRRTDTRTEGQRDRQTYITKIIVAFRNFRNTSKNTTSVI